MKSTILVWPPSRLQGVTLLWLTVIASGQAEVVTAQQTSNRGSREPAVIELRMPANLPVITMSPKPIAAIGGTRSRAEEELVARSGVLLVLRHRQRFLVVDGERLLLFNADGSLAKSIGGHGAGPGEFQDINGLCHFAGDSILVFDYRLRRYSVFDQAGVHVRTEPIPGFTYGQPCLADGSFLVRESGIAGATSVKMTAPYSVVSIQGKPNRGIGEFPLEVTGLFSRRSSLVGHGELFYVASGEFINFSVITKEGQPVRTVRVAGLPTPISLGEVEARLKSAVPTTQPKAAQERMRAFFLGLPVLKAWPMLSKLLVGTDGIVWANETNRAGQPSGWLAFTPEGKLLGRLAKPSVPLAEDVEIIGFGTREAYVKYIDGDGSPAIAVYSVRMPPTKR